MPLTQTSIHFLLPLLVVLTVVILGWLGMRAWSKGRLRLAAYEQMRKADAAQKRRREKRKQREAESAITPIDPDASRHQNRRAVVLIVDDSEMVRQNLRRTLEDNAYRVITAAHGRQAWSELQEQRPDLVITDIRMPHINGFQLLRLIRADLTLTGLPVLLLTGHEEYDVPQGQLEGASGFIRKPYKDADMLEQIKFLLQD